jgi:hypothetical protein
MALLLLTVIYLPNQIWKEEAQTIKICRDNMNTLYETQRFYYQKNNSYTDSLSKLLTFVQNDSGINRRQSLVSLTNSFTKVLNNILNVPSVQNISKMSQAAFEITGDLVGNERYFRKYEHIAASSEEIVREMVNLDSSALFPSFSCSKLFVDSLRTLKESVTDFSLQIAILRAINSLDSLSLYYSKIERESFDQFWKVEYAKISKLIDEIRATDIAKVSSVADRLAKFIDQINSNLQLLNTSSATKDAQSLEVEKQNLKELHQKFLSLDFFILTQNASLTTLSENDSIIINLTQNNFICPDIKKPYLIDTVKARITIECPNLLDDIQKEFQTCIEPIRDLPLYERITRMSGIIENTKTVLDENREELKRYTNVLLKIKELIAEFEEIKSIFFYRYANEVYEFIKLVDSEKKLSVLKPAIEDILTPIDTLASRMEKANLSDLEKKIDYYHQKLEEIDVTIAGMKLPANVRSRIKSNVEPYQPIYPLLEEIKGTFNPTHISNLRKTEKSLEKALLKALEGRKQSVYVIFSREHTNHGNYAAGEKSWEKEQ